MSDRVDELELAIAYAIENLEKISDEHCCEGDGDAEVPGHASTCPKVAAITILDNARACPGSVARWIASDRIKIAEVETADRLAAQLKADGPVAGIPILTREQILEALECGKANAQALDRRIASTFTLPESQTRLAARDHFYQCGPGCAHTEFCPDCVNVHGKCGKPECFDIRWKEGTREP